MRLPRYPFDEKYDEPKLMSTLQSSWRDENYADVYVPI